MRVLGTLIKPLPSGLKNTVKEETKTITAREDGKHQEKHPPLGGWRDGSEAKSTGCPSGGPWFSFQNPHGSSQMSITVVPGDLTPSYRHTCKTKTKSKKKKKKSNKPQIINKNTNQASKQKTTKTKTKQNKLTKESLKKKKKKKNAH